MKNCGNCVYKDLMITQEPCMRCRYTEYWEADEDKEDVNDYNFKRRNQ